MRHAVSQESLSDNKNFFFFSISVSSTFLDTFDNIEIIAALILCNIKRNTRQKIFLKRQAQFKRKMDSQRNVQIKLKRILVEDIKNTSTCDEF